MTSKPGTTLGRRADSPLLYSEHIGDMSCSSSSSSSHTNHATQSTSIKPSHIAASSPHDIYFSINPDNSRSAIFSDPLPSPHRSHSSTPTPTQSTFDEEVRRARRRCTRGSAGKQLKLKLTPQHLERLIRAYITAPFFTKATCTPRVEKWEIRDISAAREEVTTPPQVEILDLALTDVKKDREPLSFATAKTWVGSNVLNVGQETFLNAPFGEDLKNDCCFRIEPSSEGKACTVIMSVVHPVLSRWDGEKTNNLVTELNVTDLLSRAVIAELAAQSSVEADAFDTSPASPSRTVVSSQIDWCALADELQLEYELDALVDTASTCFASLTTADFSPATTALIASLRALIPVYQDFLVLSSLPRKTPGEAPSCIGVPCASAHLEWKIHDEMRVSEPRRRAFREELVGLVGTRAAAGKRFDGHVSMKGKEVDVKCVRLVALEGEREAWVCFVGTGGKGL